MTKYPINIKLHALNTAFPVYVHTIFLLAFFFLSRAVLLLHFFFLFLAQFRRRPALPSSLPPQSPFGVGGGKCTRLHFSATLPFYTERPPQQVSLYYVQNCFVVLINRRPLVLVFVVVVVIPFYTCDWIIAGGGGQNHSVLYYTLGWVGSSSFSSPPLLRSLTAPALIVANESGGGCGGGSWEFPTQQIKSNESSS